MKLCQSFLHSTFLTEYFKKVVKKVIEKAILNPAKSRTCNHFDRPRFPTYHKRSHTSGNDVTGLTCRCGGRSIPLCSAGTDTGSNLTPCPFNLSSSSPDPAARPVELSPLSMAVRPALSAARLSGLADLTVWAKQNFIITETNRYTF